MELPEVRTGTVNCWLMRLARLSRKIKRTSACRGHLFTGKSRKRKRQLRGGSLVSAADLKRVARALAG